MQVANRNPETLTLAWMVSKLPPPHQREIPGLAATIVVKGTYQLREGELAIPWPDEPTQPSGDLPSDAGGLRYGSDFVPYKPHGEWCVVGRAHGSGQPEATHCDLEFAVGASRKNLRMLGARNWKDSLLGDEVSATGSLEPLDLGYANAWGGPNEPLNPIGCGMETTELPRFETPGAPVTARHSRAVPGGYNPIPASWPQRASHVGSYHDPWARERWPWFPDDFDPRYFQSTPANQWIQGFWRGDESLTLTNLMEGRPRYSAQLPGLQVRCWLERTATPTRERRQLEPVPMLLDTIWIDLDEAKLILVWRGRCATSTPKFHDLQNLLILSEPIGTALQGEAVYAGMLEETLAPKPAKVEPTLVPAPQTVALELARAEKEMHLDRAAAYREVTAATQKFGGMMKEGLAKGIEIGQAKADPNLKEFPKPKTSLAEFDAQFKQQFAGRNVEMPNVSELLKQDPSPAQIESITAERLAAKEAESAALDAKLHPNLPDRTAFSLPDGQLDLEKMRREGCENIDWSGADFSGQPIVGMNFRNARLVGTDFSHAILFGSDFTGADLTGAKLNGAKLTMADFTEADLTQCEVADADWRRAVLTGAILSGLDLRGADFSGVGAPNADWTKADLRGAKFHRAALPAATFAEAQLDEADFSQANLAYADFRMAHAPKSRFTRADLTNFRGGDGADFTEADFEEVQGQGAIWEKSIVRGANFDDAHLESTRFVDADAEGASFERAWLNNAVIEDAKLADCNFTTANMLRVCLDRADLSRARLDGANLYEAGLWETDLQGATWHEAVLDHTRLAF